jgi:hypothetical protein
MADVTWSQLTAAEPRLIALLEEVKHVRNRAGKQRSFCANDAWYTFFEQKMGRLVGWERAGHLLLGTEAAYDAAYQHLYALLPNCRKCGCL